MIWLLWNKKEDADNNEVQICVNMGIPKENETTQRYAIPRQIANGEHTGKWGFTKPGDQYMIGVTADVEAEYDPDWWLGSQPHNIGV